MRVSQDDGQFLRRILDEQIGRQHLQVFQDGLVLQLHEWAFRAPVEAPLVGGLTLAQVAVEDAHGPYQRAAGAVVDPVAAAVAQDHAPAQVRLRARAIGLDVGGDGAFEVATALPLDRDQRANSLKARLLRIDREEGLTSSPP